MQMFKKTTEEFLRDVIIPIEQHNPDSGNLYVLIRSYPNIDCTEYEEEGESLSNLVAWSFPSNSGPGEWIEGERINLETLSGIVWHGVRGGRLYKTEFEGETKDMGPHEYFIAANDYQKIHIAAREHIARCILIGKEAKKVRLIGWVKIWKPYFLWSFALDCVERAYSANLDIVPDVYKDGIIFTRAYSRYMCRTGDIELEGLLRESSKNKNFYTLCLNRKNELEKLISERSEIGSLVYLQKAVIQALDRFKPFQTANLIRTTMALHYMGQYRKEYDFPSFNHDFNEQKIFTRIWYALHKKELDWQVKYLRNLIGD